MNTSTFMDKQIMDLTAAAAAGGASPKITTTNNDFSDLITHPHLRPPIQHDDEEEDDDDDDDDDHNLHKDDIQPSYDFQPIRPLQSTNYDPGSNSSRVWNSADSKPPNTSSPLTKKYGSSELLAPTKGILAMDRNAHDESILSEIDRTMKKYADDLLHALEGVSARLTQLETRTRNLENSVDDIKVSVGNNHGSTDGKMRQLENILREVQTGVQVLRDKHEIIEAQLELSKLQVSQTGRNSEIMNVTGSGSVPQKTSAPLQETASQQLGASAYQQLPAPALPPSFPTPQNVALPTLQSQTYSPQPLNQTPQNQIPHPTQYPPHSQTQEAPNQHPQTQQPPPPPPSSAPLKQYPGSYPSYPQVPHQHSSLPPQVQLPVNIRQEEAPYMPPQAQLPVNIRQEEAPYMPPHSYAPSLQQPPSHPPSAGTPSQQYYVPPSQVYDSPPPRSNLGYSSGYGAPSGPSEPYPYGGSAQYGRGSKSQQAPSGGSGYPQLPTARVLPQAIPTASAISGGSGSSGTGNNRVPVDDVVDKVTSMGFSREQVRATVRRLTENGQSVDLNIVLDKLMNGY